MVVTDDREQQRADVMKILNWMQAAGRDALGTS